MKPNVPLKLWILPKGADPAWKGRVMNSVRLATIKANLK